MNKVSVLVAVYNASDTIDRCVKSLLSQTHKDIQIVCVDDGSVDCSYDIINHYANIDSRITPVRCSKNMGAAHARNEGLRVAEGEYITFLDSDDTMSPDALQKALEQFGRDEAIDSVLFRCVKIDGDKEKELSLPSFDTLTGTEAFRASLYWTIHGCYIVKACIHHKYPYDESLSSYSDDNTTRLHYLASRKVARCEGIYYYYQHSASVTHTTSLNRFNHILANEIMHRQLLSMNISQDIVDEYENTRWLVLVDTYMFYFLNRHCFTREDLRKARHQMRNIYLGIDTKALRRSLKRKLGYNPMCGCWQLFRLQEELYFTLKKIMRRW